MTKPMRFRDIPWGAEYENLNDMIVYAQYMDGRLMHCKRANDDNKMGKAIIESMAYSFFDGKFYEVQILFRGWENTLALLEHLIPLLGKQHQFYDVNNHKLYDWEWDNVEIWCRYNKPGNITELVYTFKPIKDILRQADGVPVEEVINGRDVVLLDHAAEKAGIDAEKLIQQATNNTPTQETNKEGCFVATVIYNQDSIEVLRLRYWRDHVLLKHRAGHYCVDFYYLIGPHIANYIDRHSLIKKIMRKLIDCIVIFIQ